MLDNTGENTPASIKEENNFPLLIFAGFILAIIILISFFWYGYQKAGDMNFNIPLDQENVIIFDENILYSFDPNSEELNKLGKFKDQGFNNAVILSDLSQIVLVADNDIYNYSSFSKLDFVYSHTESIKDVDFSNEIILFSSGDGSAEQTYKILGEQVSKFSLGTTPFILNNQNKAVVTGSGGLRMIDLEAGDSLDTEILLPEIKSIKSSNSVNKLAILTKNQLVYVYDILSSRPFGLVEDYVIGVPGIENVLVQGNGNLAHIKTINNVTYLSLYYRENVDVKKYELPLTRYAKILIWNK